MQWSKFKRKQHNDEDSDSSLSVGDETAAPNKESSKHEM